MHVKSSSPADALPRVPEEPLLATWFELLQLKNLFRQGWLRVGVSRERCETVAEHSFGVALLSWLVTRRFFPEADVGRVLEIALFHDAGEARAGDVTPHDGVSREEKERAEREAVQRIFGGLPGGELCIARWEEYEEGATLEARIVRQVDRLEMALQACAYENGGFPGLEGFYASAEKALESPDLLRMLEEIWSLRPASTT